MKIFKPTKAIEELEAVYATNNALLDKILGRLLSDKEPRSPKPHKPRQLPLFSGDIVAARDFGK